ncbi:1-acyl-sn-glycerol-3-phosphate acyltransferase [Nannochloropsis oceanica]
MSKTHFKNGPVIPAGQGGRLLRLVVSLWGYSSMLISFVVAWWLMVLALIFICPFLPSEKDRTLFLGWIFRYISSYVIHLNPFWHLQMVGPRPSSPPTKTLVMCNHLSNADAFFLSSALLPWETKYIAKADLFQVPFGGWAMGLAGDLAIHFTRDHTGWGVKKGTVGKMMEQCKSYLSDSIPIAVFPEGGRTENGRLRPFKDGFFQLALDTNADILPCALSGTEQAWPIYESLMGPATVYVRIGSPIPSSSHTVQSLKAEV